LDNKLPVKQNAYVSRLFYLLGCFYC